MQFFRVTMTIRVAHATFFIFHINMHVISACFENKLNKKIRNADILTRKWLKIAKMRKKHGHLGLETPLGSRIAIFLKCFIKIYTMCKFLENTMTKKYWKRRYLLGLGLGNAVF